MQISVFNILLSFRQFFENFDKNILRGMVVSFYTHSLESAMDFDL